MIFEHYLGHSFVFIMAPLFLLLFTLLGVIDGLYFHIFKYKLHRLPEAKLEHSIHAARGFLLMPIIWIVFAINAGGLLLWLGILLIILDTGLEIFDIFVEREARRFIGGVSSAESVLHVMATAARVTAIALILGSKPPEAFYLTSSFILVSYPPFLSFVGTWVAIGAGIGTLFQIYTMFVSYLVRSKNGPEISNEGLLVADYNLIHIYLGAPLALLFEGIMRLIRPSVTETVIKAEEIPKNAIVYSFHKDAMLTLSTKGIISLPNVSYIGYHGMGSYIPTFYYNRLGIKAIRYKHKSKEKPKDTIIRELKKWDGIVMIRTDSGKPYGKVRGSLISLSQATGRPLVPLVQKANRFMTIFEHTFPLRKAHIKTIFGNSIQHSDIAKMSYEEARNFLQSRIDELSNQY